jgi:transposase-like protein
VNATQQDLNIGRRRRRRHSSAFKAEAVAACRQSGVSIAGVALARGLNANLLRRWVLDAERTASIPAPIRDTPRSIPAQNENGFVPVTISPSPTEAAIRIEVRRGSSTVSVEWPASAARECALLLRELIR